MEKKEKYPLNPGWWKLNRKYNIDSPIHIRSGQFTMV